MSRSDLEFMSRAACGAEGFDSRIMFAGNVRGIAQAKAVCRRCPVAGPCLTYALENCRDENCVYGGMTLGERDRYAREAALPIHSGSAGGWGA